MDLERIKFQTAEVAVQLQLNDFLADTRQVHLDDQTVNGDEVQEAIKNAEDLSKKTSFKIWLCPGLIGASDDIREIAKIVVTALVPLALAGTISLSITPVALGAVALIVARAGVRSFCAEIKSSSTEEKRG